MLVLSRKKDESLMIGNDIEIKIIEVDDGRVKIGIEAPKSIEVNRKEVYEKIKEENLKAINTKNPLKDLNDIRHKIKK